MGNITLKFKFNIELITTDHFTGKVKDRSIIHNDIMDVGIEQIMKMFNNVDSTYFRAIAIGTGSTPATSGDTTLETEVKRELATLEYEADFKAKFTKVFTFTSGESFTITEVGIFNDSVSGGVMFNRGIDAGKEVSTDTDLTVIITITGSEV